MITVSPKLVRPPSPAMAAVLEADDRVAFVRHAPGCGGRAIMLSWIVSRFLGAESSVALAGGNKTSVIISKNPQSLQAMIERWLDPGSETERWMFDYKVDTWTRAVKFVPSNTVLAFVSPARAVEAIRRGIKDVLVEDAHLCGDEDWGRALLETCALRADGHVRLLCRAQGWCEREAKNARAYRLPICDAIESGWLSDRRAQLLRGTVPPAEFQADYELDDEIRESNEPFHTFAKRRLFIRTDKPVSVLTDAQKKLVALQRGTPVVQMDPTQLQRRYGARKRLARLKAKDKGLPLRILLLKYRRGGFSTYEQAESYWLCATRPRTQVATIAHTASATSKIFRIARMMRDEDPEQPKLKEDSKSEIGFADTGSLFFVGTAGSKGFSRGDTLQRLHCSEVAWWLPGPNQMNDVNQLVAGMVAACAYGEAVFETTPNGHEWFRNKYTEAKAGLNDYAAIFLPWFEDPMNRQRAGTFDPEEIADTMTVEEKQLVDKALRLHKVVMDPAMLAFRRAQIKEHGALFPQEYPEDDETCFLISGTPYFDRDIIDAVSMAAAAYAPVRTESFPAGKLVVWAEPKRNARYCAGMDTSEGLSDGDLNGLSVIDAETGRDVAALHGRFSIDEQAHYAQQICRQYNNAFLGVERNNTSGGAVCKKLETTGYARNMYSVVEGRLGWATDSRSRPIMLSELRTFVTEHGVGSIKDPVVLSEMRTFNKQHSGKFEADPGAHDDAVIKRSIAHAMREHLPITPRLSVG